MESHFRTRLILLAALALAGCNGPPLTTQWKLRNFTLANADLGQLRVALSAPDWARLTPEATVIRVDDTQDETAKPAQLRARRGDGDEAELARLAPGKFAVYELAGPDLTAARALQAQALARRERGEAPRKTVEIAAGLACREREAPAGPALIDLWIHPDDATGWLPLLERYDVAPALRQAEKDGKLAALLPRCGQAPLERASR